MEEMDKERPEPMELEADVLAPPAGIIRKAFTEGGIFSSFHYRDFSILWSGALLSNIGTWIHMSALFWYVKEITGSDAWVGLVTVANFIPVLFLVLFAGSLADVLDRKLLILSTLVLMMLGALALGIFTSFGAANLAVIMVITFVMGTAFTFNFPAWRAIITDLVPPREILNAVALDAAEFNLARSIGPALGGVIYGAIGVGAAFYINAASFLTVIIAIMMVKTKTPKSPPPPEGVIRHVGEILAYTWSNRWAFNVLVVLIIASIFGVESNVGVVSQQVLQVQPLVSKVDDEGVKSRIVDQPVRFCLQDVFLCVQ